MYVIEERKQAMTTSVNMIMEASEMEIIGLAKNSFLSAGKIINESDVINFERDLDDYMIYICEVDDSEVYVRDVGAEDLANYLLDNNLIDVD